MAEDSKILRKLPNTRPEEFRRLPEVRLRLFPSQMPAYYRKRT